jgi:hypothetical protein
LRGALSLPDIHGREDFEHASGSSDGLAREDFENTSGSSDELQTSTIL